MYGERASNSSVVGNANASQGIDTEDQSGHCFTMQVDIEEIVTVQKCMVGVIEAMAILW